MNTCSNKSCESPDVSYRCIFKSDLLPTTTLYLCESCKNKFDRGELTVAMTEPWMKLLKTNWDAELSEHEEFIARSGSPYPFVKEKDLVTIPPGESTLRILINKGDL